MKIKRNSYHVNDFLYKDLEMAAKAVQSFLRFRPYYRTRCNVLGSSLQYAFFKYLTPFFGNLMAGQTIEHADVSKGFF